MAIRDRNIDWQRKSHFIYPNAFIGAVASTALVSGDTGAMAIVELDTLGWGGLGAGQAADKAQAIDFNVVREADPTKEIGVRIHWVVDAATGIATDDAVHYVVHYQQLDHGAVIAASSTVLNTPIAAQSPAATTDKRFYRTSRGIINANTLDFTARAGVMLWEINIGTFTGFEANEPIILGLEIDYMPLLCMNSEEDTPGARNEDLAVA